MIDARIVIPVRIVRMGDRLYASIPKRFHHLAEEAKTCIESGECRAYIIVVDHGSFEDAISSARAEEAAEEGSIPEPIVMSLKWATEYGLRLAEMVRSVRSRRIPSKNADLETVGEKDVVETGWESFTWTSS